ncbi:uncharacterized protein LOC129592285 [Paramacrobiotus metropolitanus]|uniref:uncharacterized protein LOC129592285 n=1 Tax=Paramacrobiotus metropolitanus TaxID=2943436 RepID=UPI0024460307|nr:uncharacterized protein LOC129592285 [Paramacrobiotus metropolitanus]XP_055344259.1 uncharacterized protein LOC129592285 [Paramacrobiotus metropolitanus]
MYCPEWGVYSTEQLLFLGSQDGIPGTQILNALLMRAKHPFSAPETSGYSTVQLPFLSSQDEIRGTQILNAILMRAKHPFSTPETSALRCNIAHTHPTELPVQPTAAPGWENRFDETTVVAATAASVNCWGGSVSMYDPALAGYPSKSSDHDNHGARTITNQGAALRIPRPKKRKNPRVKREHDQTAQEDLPPQNAGSKLLDSSSDSLGIMQCKNKRSTADDAKVGLEAIESRREARSVSRNIMATNNLEASFKMNIPSEERFSDGRKQKEQIMGTRCEGFAATIPLLQSGHAITNSCSGRYQCQACHLSWDDEEAFLLHLAGKEHVQLYGTGIFLYCTGCQFRTRKPAKMGRHIFKYQSQSALQNGDLHSVKLNVL